MNRDFDEELGRSRQDGRRRETGSPDSRAAVSYTHLDVYKRQILKKCMKYVEKREPSDMENGRRMRRGRQI